jgi:hypothetical protein
MISKNKLKTAVLFLVFNRLDTTKQVFEEIKKAKPLRLYIASDGHREKREGEKEIVGSVRQYILDNVDWDCEVKTLFRDNNLGCKIAVSEAITWFFENEEMGIILEDDCLPSQSFFWFCEELLEKYKHDKRVGIISGNNFNDKKIGDADYYFKKIPHIWGWATWKRVWNDFDINMTDYPEFKRTNKIKEVWVNKKYQSYWLDIFDRTYKDEINSWAYRLTFNFFNKNILSICPNFNMVKNIGFGDDSTNTLIKVNGVSNLDFYNITFPLKHPENIICDKGVDDYINKKISNFYFVKKLFRKMGLLNLFKKYVK